MGKPKYKKYPVGDSKSAVEDSRTISEYQRLIRSSLKDKEQIKKAALILEIWLNTKTKKP